MNYQDMTDLLYRKASTQADAVMDQIGKHCRDDYAIRAVLKREMFVLACIAANIATRNCNENLDGLKKPNAHMDRILAIVEGKKNDS